MCRYAAPYKPHFACFQCRKTFKRRLLIDINRDKSYANDDTPAKCPDCGNPVADMGLDFESPKKNDIKSWKHFENLYITGITFHSCGCFGPGYIPADQHQLSALLDRRLQEYIEQRRFWSSAIEPSTNEEWRFFWKQNGDYLWNVPDDLKTGTPKMRRIEIEKATKHWTDKISKLQHHLRELKTSSH